MNFLLVDDHSLYTDGLKSILRSQYADSHFDTAAKYQGVLDKLSRNKFNVIFLDINLAGVNMMDKIVEVLKSNPDAKIIILSSYFTPQLMRTARSSGASAYLVKNSSKDDILYATQKVLSSDEYIVSGYRKEDSLDNYDSFKKTKLVTDREKEIINLLAKGFNNSKIAEELFISASTVHTHRKNIYKKLDLKSVQELISYAYRFNLISV